MPRNPTRKLDPRSYCKYTHEALAAAIQAVASNEMTLQKASVEFGIPAGTLSHRMNGKHSEKPGRPTVLNEEEEASLVEHLLTLAKWGFPFDTNDLKHMVKGYLDRLGRQVPIFKENMPAEDWASTFLKSHENAIGEKMCQNIKPTRANISAEYINSFFDHLANTLTDSDGSPIRPTNSFNYDETNLTEDPGSKKCIFRRGSNIQRGLWPPQNLLPA